MSEASRYVHWDGRPVPVDSATGRPAYEVGVIYVGSQACPLCRAEAKSLDASVVYRPQTPSRRRGRPISRATAFKLAHPLKCAVCRARFKTASPGPAFRIQMGEWRDESIYSVVVVK